MTRLQDITADELMMKRGQKGSKAVRLDHRQLKAVLRDREDLEKEIDELQKENQRHEYNFREAQKKITVLEGIDAEQKKELHRLNTEINKTKDESDKSRKIQELETKIAEVAQPAFDAPDKEQIIKIGERMQRIANVTADQIIEASSIERKGVLGTKKEIDVPTLRKNIAQVLDQHNELHKESWGILKKFGEIKEKILATAKNVIESSKTALKTIFSAKEEKSLPGEKSSALEWLKSQSRPETPEEAKERIQKVLAEQRDKKRNRGMQR
jgi:septum formation topological specificity factor MinE